MGKEKRLIYLAFGVCLNQEKERGNVFGVKFGG
jgi:hypothetical protein